MDILELSVNDVAAKMNDESVFIDVREPDEYEEVHAKGVKTFL